MSMKKLLFLLLFLAGFSLLFKACDSDDDNGPEPGNEIEITIVSPHDGEVIPMAEAEEVDIYVMIEATDENHDIDIEVFLEDEPGDKIADWHLHRHVALIEFNEPLDLSSFEAGTKFRIEVTACIDHDCDEYEHSQSHFSVGE
ncbi:MAG: hypothetical protein EA411_05465 [Saprospirales bacterium]|nr:MAG: hypothetical protein EA411_05465 [Saprospirales bacterium]